MHATSLQIAVFDLNGKIITSQAVNGASSVINVSSFASGTYLILLVKDGTASTSMRFVKL